MKKKYILALTFLCLLVGQNCFAQDWIELDEIIITNDPCDIRMQSYDPCECFGANCDSGDPCDYFSSTYDPDLCGGGGDPCDPCDPNSSAYNEQICSGGGGGSGGTEYTGGSGGGGGGSSGGSGISYLEMVQVIASNAIATGQAFTEYYTTIGDAIFSTTPQTVSTNTFIKSVFDSSALTSTFKQELTLAGQLKGMAIISVTGKLLGITGAVMSIDKLIEDYQDDGSVSMINVVDVGISVGSLFIKSNVVGLGVSAGWLLIKGDFGN